MRRIARLFAAAGLVALGCFAAAPAHAQTAAAGDDLFTLRTSDLTGPISVPAGQGIWRTAAIRNVSTDYRLTVGLVGSGEHADWVDVAAAQVEIDPGEQQLVRFSVTPPVGSTGTVELGVEATLLEARSVLIVGESPMVTAQVHEITFTVEVPALGPAAANPTGRENVAAEGSAADESTATGATVSSDRIVAGLLTLTGLLGTIVSVTRLLRHRAERQVTSPSTSSDARAVVGTPGDERLAQEATRQLAHRIRSEDRTEAVRERVHRRASEKTERRAAARTAAIARIENDSTAELDRHVDAESSRAVWLRARTAGARRRMAWTPIPRVAEAGEDELAEVATPPAGRDPLPFEATIADRPLPPLPAPRSVAVERAADDSEPVRPTRASRAPRRRRDRVEVLALDVDRLNAALEARRQRDGFDSPRDSVSAR